MSMFFSFLWTWAHGAGGTAADTNYLLMENSDTFIMENSDNFELE